MAGAGKAARQRVHEKAADELASVERHGFEPVAAFDAVVLPFERDARVVERERPRVEDRAAAGAVREIGEHGVGSGERALDADDPFRASSMSAWRIAAIAWLLAVPLSPNSNRLSPFAIQSAPAPSARSCCFRNSGAASKSKLAKVSPAGGSDCSR
jgi:hypothetical protein